ncbi:MAG: phosphoribosylformylglycinamidine synthase, partial [Gammaproteobacteria bacterium]
MLQFRGGPALSEFRLQKLLANLRTHLPALSALSAEFHYFMDVSRALDAKDERMLHALLAEGPGPAAEVPPGSPLVCVPRFGTVSPWSSKATDIAHNCGLSQVRRIERGVVFYLQHSGAGLRRRELEQAAHLLHDRMTQTLVMRLDEAEGLFHAASPAGLESVDILHGGRQALEKANRDAGFA